MGCIRLGDLTTDLQAGGASWAPMTGGNSLGTTPPAMAPGYDDGTRGIVVDFQTHTGPRLSDAELAALQSNQALICKNARNAQARNSPAAPGLVQSCMQLRAANFAKGRFLAEPVPPDPAYRVQLTDAGQAIVNASPQLSTLYASLQPNPATSNQRMFLWAAAVAKGQAGPGFVAFLFGPNVGASGEILPASSRAPMRQEFERFLRIFSGTQAAAAASDDGIPTGVLIAGGALGVAGLAFLAWKFLL